MGALGSVPRRPNVLSSMKLRNEVSRSELDGLIVKSQQQMKLMKDDVHDILQQFDLLDVK